MWKPFDLPPTGERTFTDYSRWRLLVNDGGRHTWHYLHTDEEVANWPQNEVDRFWLGLKTVSLSEHMLVTRLIFLSLIEYARLASTQRRPGGS